MRTGRPKGSYKYKDKTGNPISVFEWRRISKPQQRMTVTIPKEYLDVFNELQKEYEYPTKAELAKDIIVKYLKGRKNGS